jgi:uncharacterized BrkB/YihY/UPF0761 family membrane protein
VEEEPTEAGAPLSKAQRAKARSAALRAWTTSVGERAHAERERHSTVDALFEIVDHDSEVGGGIMAGALAYRLFIWMLPLALVAVAGLGIASSAASTTPEKAAKSMGLAGLVSSSVAAAGHSSARWYALLVGIPILFMTTRSVLRTLIVTHRLVWTDLRGSVPKPTLKASLQMLAAFVGFFVISGFAAFVRGSTAVGGVVATIVIAVPYAALWLLISWRLPHRGAPWRALVPGAVLFGFGVEALHVVTAYLIGPQATSKQGTYGALGLAAALLLGLFFFSRLVIATAVVNVTLFERRSRAHPRAGPADEDTGAP